MPVPMHETAQTDSFSQFPDAVRDAAPSTPSPQAYPEGTDTADLRISDTIPFRRNALLPESAGFLFQRQNIPRPYLDDDVRMVGNLFDAIALGDHHQFQIGI